MPLGIQKLQTAKETKRQGAQEDTLPSFDVTVAPSADKAGHCAIGKGERVTYKSSVKKGTFGTERLTVPWAILSSNTLVLKQH